MKDWRYCECGHQPNDHNPIHFGCFLCKCQQWKPDLERSRSEGVIRCADENPEQIRVASKQDAERGSV